MDAIAKSIDLIQKEKVQLILNDSSQKTYFSNAFHRLSMQ